VGASKKHQLDDNLAAANLVLGVDEVTELDALTKPAAVYPNWFGEMVLDGAVKEVLGR